MTYIERISERISGITISFITIGFILIGTGAWLAKIGDEIEILNVGLMQYVGRLVPALFIMMGIFILILSYPIDIHNIPRQPRIADYMTN